MSNNNMFNNQNYNQNDFGGSLDGGDNGQQQNQNYNQQMNPQQQYVQQQQMQGYNQMDPQQYQMMMQQQQYQQQYQQQMGQQYGGQPQQQFGYQNIGQQFGNAGGMNNQQQMYNNQQYYGMQQPNMGMQQQPQQVQATPAEPAAATTTQTPLSSLTSVFDMSKVSAVSEFVPKDKVALTKEQFPDLDDAFGDEPKQSKKQKKNNKNKGKGGNANPTSKLDDEAVDESTAWKGKPSKFFTMEIDNEQQADPTNPGNFKMNQEQWNFVFRYYPEYGSGPYDLMVWLFNQVILHENKDPYSKPGLGGRQTGSEIEEPQDINSILANAQKAEKGLKLGGAGGGQQLNKKQMEQKRKVDEEERLNRIKIEKDRLEREKGPQDTDEQKKEKAMLKAFKDRPVNLNPPDAKEVDQARAPASMVFIGHVDAGKSTICGNLMYLTNVVDARTIEKYKQEAKDKGRDSWWLAYVMDSNEEEKAKGKTVEVGRAQFDTPTKKYTIFDAPGHKNYVPNMIMGAACADVAGLVISARKGEFEAGFEADGQSREHAQLAKSLGVQKLVVVVNKMDDCRWDKARYDQIVKDLAPFLKATGYADEDITYIPISGLSSDNIATRVDEKVCSWYQGPTLLEVIDGVQLMPRFPAGPLRMPILDKWKEQELTAFGKVENGTLRLGDKLAIMPSGVPAQVLGLLDAKGQVVKYATPGENVSVTLNVAGDDQVQRGFVLCQRDSMMPVTDVFEAELDILDLLDYKPIISKGYTCMMHIHTHADEVTISHIVKSFEKNDRGEVTEKQKPQFARSQTKIICRINPRNPVSLEKFETIQQMGRFTLRDDGKTICVGKVLKYKPYSKTGAQAQPAAAAKKADSTHINSASSEPVKGEVVMNLETGEVKEKEKPLGAIAEGAEDENAD